MERKYNLDLLRVLSALAVIIIHTVSSPVIDCPYPLDAALTGTLDCVHNLMNWSVPVFFMITGYCILGKRECTYEYCFARVTKYLLVLATVGLAYALLEEVFLHRSLNASILLTSVQKVITGNLLDHMWYVYAIIGIYLVLPVIHSFMALGKKNRLILTALLFLFTILLPALEPRFETGFSLPFGGYLFYVSLGGVFAKGDLGKKTRYTLMAAGLGAALWILLHKGDFFGYRSLPACLMAAGIFAAANELRLKPSRALLTVSQCTWGIYLLHPLFLHTAIKALRIDFLSPRPYLQLSALSAALFLLSFAATWILRRIPVIKKLF